MTRRLNAPDTPADIAVRAALDSKPRRGFVVVAGAGSGKTTSLVKALAHVASKNGSELRRRGQRIACITYTEVAAKEIAEDVGTNGLVVVSTIHSFLWQLVRPFQTDIAGWVEAKIRRKLEKALTELERSGIRDGTRRKHEEERSRLESLLNSGLNQHYTYGLASKYEDGVLGHSDILAMVPEILMTRPLLARLTGALFPYILVDESQDTFPSVVDSLKAVEKAGAGSVCLGFFGDPMQQIYQTGTGAIKAEDGWEQIPKPENFRSSKKVLDLVNRVRLPADGLVQVPGSGGQQQGDAHFFVLPADEHSAETLTEVRAWLTRQKQSGDWTSDGSAEETKTLVIVHRMAADQLGFGNLYSAFHDVKGSKLGDAFDAGTAWPLAPFSRTILPLVEADASSASVVRTIRSYGTVLDNLSVGDVRRSLATARAATQQLRRLVAAGGPGSVGRVLRHAFSSGLLVADPRFAGFFDADGEPTSTGELTPLQEVLTELSGCDIAEVKAYYEYAGNVSPFSTQHGTKGAEYPRVLVVLDDRAQFNLYSYEKLLGSKQLSATDVANQKAGKESVVERTRRLLYVCVSRAIDAVAVVLYSDDVEAATNALRDSGLADDQIILTLDHIRQNQDATSPR